eukprot:TRINITY_DN20919_c0_g1_i2.p1 TRINITY_DN20919_c0_g1~~TRINITY_DN20919_c0_g1_i2.p1  ORF type:complete len:283 (-),score=80.07 TRINITY_DN20919_c0_g1_i2:608-1456(-)
MDLFTGGWVSLAVAGLFLLVAAAACFASVTWCLSAVTHATESDSEGDGSDEEQTKTLRAQSQPCCAGSNSKAQHSEEAKTKFRAAALAAAAGVHLRAKLASGDTKAFMRVSVEEGSFAGKHVEDMPAMVKAFEEAEDEPLMDAEEEVGMDLEHEPRAPTKEEVLGDYLVSGGPYHWSPGAGSKYAVKSFAILPEDVLMYDEIKKYCEEKGKAQQVAHALGEGRVVMHIHLMKRNCVFKHGCFCLGMFWMTQASEESGPSRPVLMRYNRWAEDLSPYWAAIKQ